MFKRSSKDSATARFQGFAQIAYRMTSQISKTLLTKALLRLYIDPSRGTIAIRTKHAKCIMGPDNYVPPPVEYLPTDTPRYRYS